MSKEKKHSTLGNAFLTLLESQAKNVNSLPTSDATVGKAKSGRTLGQEFYSLVCSLKVSDPRSRVKKVSSKDSEHTSSEGGKGT